MALTEQQTAAIERLRENESLTGNLTDKPAMAVLAWAEEQIKASAVYEDVVAAVKAANRTGTEDVAEALGAARKSLDAALAARGMTLTPPPAEPATAPAAAPSAPPVSGAATPANPPTEPTAASAPPTPPPPAEPTAAPAPPAPPPAKPVAAASPPALPPPQAPPEPSAASAAASEASVPPSPAKPPTSGQKNRSKRRSRAHRQ